MAMEFLRKSKKISNHSALLILFFAWYVTATTTTLLVKHMTEEVLSRTGIVLLAVLLFMTVVYGISRVLKRTDVIDAAWGAGFAVAAIVSFSINEFTLSIGWNIQTLVTVLVCIWAIRLAHHIIRRLLRHPEDKRYIELRQKWKGNESINTYVRIFVVQALLATGVSIAVIHINLSQPQSIGTYAYIGAAVWLVGFLFEAIGDWQLKRHLANPANKGKLMTSGLWRYTRHPNYFGESLLWWGIFIIALGTPFGWVAVLTPFVITYLLLFVSGVPLTERAFVGRKGWAAYKKRTSVFIPLPPKA